MVNKGGRPRKAGAKQGLKWKPIYIKSKHNYEVSNQGAVRRQKKDGDYYLVKPWFSKSPYAAVYIYGVPGATRGRKKAYVHRLVAEAFVAGKRPGKVVHHTQGPSNNAARGLEWTTVDENLNARKYKKKTGPPPQKSVPEKKVTLIKPKKPVKADNSDKKPAWSDAWTVRNKVNYCMLHMKFKPTWSKFRQEMPSVNKKNLAEMFKKATGKGLVLKGGPVEWVDKLKSAVYAIREKLEV